jgi:hypothetical protein
MNVIFLRDLIPVFKVTIPGLKIQFQASFGPLNLSQYTKGPKIFSLTAWRLYFYHIKYAYVWKCIGVTYIRYSCKIYVDITFWLFVKSYLVIGIYKPRKPLITPPTYISILGLYCRLQYTKLRGVMTAMANLWQVGLGLSLWELRTEKKGPLRSKSRLSIRLRCAIKIHLHTNYGVQN